MGDRIVVLREGHVQQVDTPLNLYNDPVNRFVAGFIGSPSMNLVDGAIVREDGLHFRAKEGTFTLPIDQSWAGHFDTYASSTPVTMGIRPEDLYLAGSPYVEGPTAEASFQLDVVEPMGNEIIIYLRADALDEQIVGRIAPQDLPDTGASIDLAFDLQKLHFFDAETGESLLSQRMAEAAS